MEVLGHHIYEYKKGLRSLVLHTMRAQDYQQAKEVLERKQIEHLIYWVNERKFNVFFGKRECIEVLKSFGKQNLNDFTDEEDFILGTMLGYDRIQQCQRLLKRKRLKAKVQEPQPIALSRAS